LQQPLLYLVKSLGCCSRFSILSSLRVAAAAFGLLQPPLGCCSRLWVRHRAMRFARGDARRKDTYTYMANNGSLLSEEMFVLDAILVIFSEIS
jgi:hypothetical protein